MIDAEIATVLEATPGFVDRYLGLVEAADGDPGAAATFTELADHVAGLLGRIDHVVLAIMRCLEGVESVAGHTEASAEIVAWAFLDSLSPDDRRRLVGWLGPRTLALLREVDAESGEGS